MRPIKFMLRQYATYWAYTGTNQYGQNTYSAAAEIRVRWEDMTEELILPSGERFNCKVHIYSFIPIPLNSFLLLARLADVDTTKSPQKLRAYEMLRVATTPSLSAKRAVYEAWG